LDEHASAYRAAQPKAQRWKNLDAPEFRAKLGGFLARRGFNYDVTRDTVKRLWDELNGPADADTEEGME
jgi:regulatory protein